MPKIIKYSELFKKLDKIIHLPIKNIDTIILDKYNYELDENRNTINLKNIIIDKDLIDYGHYINIIETKAENIYFENYKNIGGITIPYDVIITEDIELKIVRSNENNIRELNIILNDNTIKNIKIEENFNKIIIKKFDKNLIINIDYPKEKLKYTIDSLGNIREFKNTYIIDNSDIKNDSLDLTNLTEYNNLLFHNKNIDTLIINKHYIENPRKLYELSAHKLYVPFHYYMHFDKLKIIDDNSMKLLPIDKTFDNANSRNTNFISNGNKYIYINEEKENNNTLIYLDKNKNIKILDKKEILKDKDIEEVIIDIKKTSTLRNNSTELILIKYKNYYIIKDFDNEYKIDSLFFIILSNNPRKYFDEEYLINALKNYDLITIFNSVYFSKNLFYEMYSDYIEYKNYIDKLKNLGFTNASIKYLFDKKVESIIHPNEDNLNNISSTEIKCFNEIGEDYIKKKRLKHE